MKMMFRNMIGLKWLWLEWSVLRKCECEALKSFPSAIICSGEESSNQRHGKERISWRIYTPVFPHDVILLMCSRNHMLALHGAALKEIATYRYRK